jgi:hypothetical protein
MEMSRNFFKRPIKFTLIQNYGYFRQKKSPSRIISKMGSLRLERPFRPGNPASSYRAFSAAEYSIISCINFKQKFLFNIHCYTVVIPSARPPHVIAGAAQAPMSSPKPHKPTMSSPKERSDDGDLRRPCLPQTYNKITLHSSLIHFISNT